MITMEDINIQLGVMQQEIKDISRRMDNLEKLTASVYDLAASVKLLTANQKTTEENVAQIADDVDELKNRPAKRWEAVVAALIAGIVGAFVGRLFK